MHPELLKLLQWDKLLTFDSTCPEVQGLKAEAWLASANSPEFQRFFKDTASHANPCVPFLLFNLGKAIGVATDVIENQVNLCQNWLGKEFTLTGFVGHLVDNVAPREQR